MSLSPSAPKSKNRRVSAAQFGMVLFLISLGVLFAASLVAFLVTRFSHPAWSRIDVGLPWGLLAATALLGGVSFALEVALRAIRNNRQRGLQQWLLISAALAIAFLIGQLFNWYDIQRLNQSFQSRLLSLFTFYLLTGLHALHVLGGLAPLGLVYYRAGQREYSSSRYEGVRLCTQYWHFLLGVWLVLLTTMYLA